MVYEKYRKWYMNTKNGICKIREIPEMVHEKQPKYQKWYTDTQNGICESRGNTRNGTYVLWNKN